MNCWQKRGCDDEMASRCPHAVLSADGVCPISCYFANCGFPQRKYASNLDLLLDATVDRSAAIKEPCTYCEHFLTNGPRLA
ncbi:MAG: hypothetical protein LBP91_06030 [Coriobacteriales bacterium]|nr:hypothetical protein [Coriobacteriales bacterium]